MSGRLPKKRLMLGLGLVAALAIGIASAQDRGAAESARQPEQPAQLDRGFGGGDGGTIRGSGAADGGTMIDRDGGLGSSGTLGPKTELERSSGAPGRVRRYSST